MEDSRTLDELQALKDTGRLEEAVLPVETVFSGYKEIRSGDASMDRLFEKRKSLPLPDGRGSQS